VAFPDKWFLGPVHIYEYAVNQALLLIDHKMILPISVCNNLEC